MSSTDRSLRRDISNLRKGSVIYLIPTIVTRGLSFFLTPLYTRFMSVDDYGIVGVATSLVPMLALLLGLSIHSAPSRLYHAMPDDRARARLVGTVSSFLLVIPPALGLFAEFVHRMGAIAPLKSVPFDPYLRLVLWSSILVLQSNVALNMLVVREEHRRAATLNTLMVLSTAAFTVLGVVVLRWGAIGQLRALLLANGFMAIVSFRIMWRLGRPTMDMSVLKQALAFSIPLVPHELSKWILAASDRLILERNVLTADLGRYTLGYTFGASVGILTTAVSNAFFPIVQRKLTEGDKSNDVPMLGNLVCMGSAFAALEVAALFPSLIRWIMPTTYHSAGIIVPWVSLGFFFQALYMIWSQGTFFSRRTSGIAVVTALGSALNIGLNIVMVPRFGIRAAAVSTAVGYAAMAGLHAWLAQRMHPIPWEYGRMARVGLAALGAFALSLLPRGFSPLVELIIRGSITVLAFPALALAFRAVSVEEIRRAQALYRGR